jgi:hypothetical protein
MSTRRGHRAKNSRLLPSAWSSVSFDIQSAYKFTPQVMAMRSWQDVRDIARSTPADASCVGFRFERPGGKYSDTKEGKEASSSFQIGATSNPHVSRIVQACLLLQLPTIRSGIDASHAAEVVHHGRLTWRGICKDKFQLPSLAAKQFALLETCFGAQSQHPC